MCVACRRSVDNDTLIRISRFGGEVSVDVPSVNKKRRGRGAYIHNNGECLKIAVKKGSLSRALKCRVPDEIYLMLDTVVKENHEQ